MDSRTTEPADAIDDATIDQAVDALVAGDPDAFVSMLGEDGFVVPPPASFALADRVVTWRRDRTIMVDVVVPADRMAVIKAWERARRKRMALVKVRLANDPDQLMTLALADTTHRFGVWLAIFTHTDTNAESNVPAPTERSIAPLRPRTATMHKNMTAIITRVDDNVTKLLGWPAEMIVGQRSSEFIHPDDQDRAIETWIQMLATQAGQRVRFRHRCLDGSWMWVEVDNLYLHADDPDQIRVVAQVTDISDEMAAHNALEQRERLFRRLAESLPVGLFQVGASRSIAYANARAGDILGIEQARTLADQLSTVIDASRPALDRAFEAVFADGTDSELEIQVRHPATSELRLCTMTLVAVTGDDGAPGVIVTVNDVTDSARLRDELRVMATFDPLTGCYTRQAFLAALDELLIGPERDGAGVVFVDLDNFKPVNDRLGHAAGDELLEHVAQAIRAVVRDDDIVGRIGGDEFLIACRGLGRPGMARAIADRLRQALSGTVDLSVGTVELQASIGVAYAGDDTDREALIARADTAMYQSKRAGQGIPVLHAS